MPSAREPRNRGEPAQASEEDRAPFRSGSQSHVEPKTLASERLAPGLHVVSTPIGRLRDITLHALDVLAAADVVLCEDTRVTRRLCDAHGIKAKLERYDDQTGAKVRPDIIERLKAGARIALASDAGTPLISDPGFKLVKEAAAAGVQVYAAPGPSAALAALTVSGLPTDRFLFAGFPPAKSAARRKALEDVATVPATLVFFESGPRLAESLADMVAVFGDRDACVARELTKLHEEARRGRLPDLAAAYADAPAPKGEIVVLIGPPGSSDSWDDEAVDAAVRARLGEASVKEIAAEIAAASGRPRREVYARALALKHDAER